MALKKLDINDLCEPDEIPDPQCVFCGCPGIGGGKDQLYGFTGQCWNKKRHAKIYVCRKCGEANSRTIYFEGRYMEEVTPMEDHLQSRQPPFSLPQRPRAL